jgi:signal transduction histidine kinase/ligand-binding sensor domain-containing protein
MIVCPRPQPAICPGKRFPRAIGRKGAASSAAALVVLLVGTVGGALGQSITNVSVPEQSAEFAIETWRTDNGIPQNSITAVLQTRRGYIWAGTYNGVVQFDGLRFKVFDSANTKGLLSSRVTSLSEDAKGDIWIGHDKGEVTQYTDGKFVPAPIPAAWGRVPIKDIVTDEQGELWVLNQLGEALRFKDQVIHKPPALMGENPFVNPRVTMDGRKQAYVVRNGVVARFSSRGYELMDFGDPSVRPYYPALAAARDGNIWVIGEGQVRKWGTTNWIASLGPAPWGDASLTTTLETSSGRLFVGTLQNGLYVFDPATSGWLLLNRTNGLPQDWVCSLAEDTEKNLWVGTGGGLAVLRKRKVMMLSPPDDWAGRPVYSITRAQDGSVWAATEGAGLYHLAAGQWQRYGPEEGLANQFVWSVLEDSQQQVWAGTWGGGLFRLENGTFVAQTNLIPTSDPVVALKESPPGTLWVGTGAGLVRVRSNTVTRLASFGGAAAGDVRVIETGADGEIWIGTQGAGLGHWQNGVFKTFQTADGLASDFILSLLREPDGTLWIGTLEMGLCRYRNGEFRQINTSHGLPGNIVYHIEADEAGNFWFNSLAGLYRITKRELNDCADGKLATVPVLAFGKAEGMSTLAGTGGFTPSGFRAPDGQLWFSTARGIAVVSPKAARLNKVRPIVWIEEVSVDGQPASITRESASEDSTRPARASARPARQVVVLQPGRRQLDIQFTGLSFTSPERVQFKYRLEGLDPDWMPVSFRRRVNYSFLTPGEYKFHVIACNSDGLWSETGDMLTIRMLPYFWQTWWFKTALLIAGGLLLALIFFLESRRRLHRKLERIARERELERERSRIAQDIHDDLGASLTRIGMLSQSVAGDLHDPPRAIVNLNQIYDTARDLTRAMDEIVWAVNPRHDTLESLTNYIARFAHDFLRTAHIRCRLDVPMQLPDSTVRSEVRHNLFLAFKETLNNAVKHSAASEVRVTFELQLGGLKLVVADNGTGFHPGKKPLAPAGDRVVSGYGMASIRARLEQVGGRVEIRSQVGQGTRVELFVPLLEMPQPIG